MKAKVKRVPISPEVLLYNMQLGTAWRVAKGIPADARLRGFTLDPYANVLNLFVEHESFEEIEDGEVAPILETLFYKIQ